LTRSEKGLLNGAAAATAASGLAFAGFKYLMTSDDPFSAVNHPLQPWALALHVLAAPVLLFTVGMIYKEHVLGKMKNGSPARVRRIGTATVAVLAPLALSGYLLQVMASGGARSLTAWVHLGLGALFVVAYGAHLITSPSRAAAAAGARNGKTIPGATVTGIQIGRRQGTLR
jgi:hypothetical protein